MFKHKGGTIKEEETVKDTKQVGDNEVKVTTAAKGHFYFSFMFFYHLGIWVFLSHSTLCICSFAH
jgi:hypothetical protein